MSGTYGTIEKWAPSYFYTVGIALVPKYRFSWHPYCTAAAHCFYGAIPLALLAMLSQTVSHWFEYPLPLLLHWTALSRPLDEVQHPHLQVGCIDVRGALWSFSFISAILHLEILPNQWEAIHLLWHRIQSHIARHLFCSGLTAWIGHNEEVKRPSTSECALSGIGTVFLL